MTELVVDASVFVSLFDKESANTKWAEQLMELASQDLILIVCPDLTILELTNVLVKMKKVEPKEVDRFMKMLESVGVEFMQLLSGDALDIAKYMKKYSLTAYDASYLLLAEMSESQLITEDRELLKVPRSVSLKNFFDDKMKL